MSDTRVARVRTAAPTLHDVAHEAGVSLATASRVLNGSTRKVAESYRERVQDAASRLGYTANLSAQATARGTSAIIALLVADIADPYFGQIAAGVARGADEAGLVVTIATTERDAEREQRVIHALRGQRPRGIILAASRTAESARDELQAELEAIADAGSRIVVVGPPADGLRAVTVDNRGGARALGAALAERGYREAVILAAAEGVRTSDDRIVGFTEGFTAEGGTVARIHRGDFSREAGERLAAEALAAGVAPGTVLFGVSDVVAIGAMSGIRAAGREVGADVAVAGFDDIPTGRDVTPSLTTVRVPLDALGFETFRAATLDDWSGQAAFDLEVVVRESTPTRAA
ncbi:LacI family transcriptional regulator [Microbacterium protaetiae]|uniref:LacI family transcriptional regulator n=1 Tax=Microbacterium protaetiae TaxID=2509458 RepID=A0A4P6ECJ3_9MICO|nr:LacI family DNA-binding transcriptional regulator [Microbacterium protaetiae]QAY59063.1 LacI family transcriptional regulator [Microbacterium protaetiae]